MLELLAQWWRNRFSASWPWTPTVVESGVVYVIRGRNAPDSYHLTAYYTYTVNGKQYDGEYNEGLFQTEHAANAVLKSLKELPPPARYKPNKPEISVMSPYRDVALGLARSGSSNQQS